MFGLDPVPFTAKMFASIVNHKEFENTQWVLDTSFYLQETDKVVWDGLLAKKHRLGITEAIGSELAGWLTYPDHKNKQIVEHINDVKYGSNSEIQLISLRPLGPDFIFLVEYYVNLIGFRKNLGPMAESIYQYMHKKKPNPAELSDFIKKFYGNRAQLIYGRDRNIKVSGNRFNDEQTICIGLINAILSNTEVCFVTSDEGFFDQFSQFCLLIINQYSSFLAANAFFEDSNFFRSVGIVSDDRQSHFVNNVRLLARNSDFMLDILPKHYTPIPISCFLIQNNSGQQTIAQQTWLAELEIRNLFKTKIQSRGMNTCLFGKENFHVSIGTSSIWLGNYMALGEDMVHSFNTKLHSISLSRIDLDIVAYDSTATMPSPQETPRYAGGPRLVDFLDNL